MDRIVRTLDAIDHETSRAELAEEAAQVQSALDDTVDLQAAMRSAMLEARDERRAKLEKQSRGPSGTGEGAKRRVLPGRTEEATRSTVKIWMPLLAVILVGGGLLLWSQSSSEGNAPQAVDGLPALADRSPPEIARIEDLPGAVQPVVADLGAGDCRTAAGRLRGLVRANPEEPRLELLEGAAWVCAGNEGKALKILEPLSKAKGGTRAPRTVWWFLAQAHLLAGNAEGALEALTMAEREDPRHRGRAGAQKEQIEAAANGG